MQSYFAIYVQYDLTYFTYTYYTHILAGAEESSCKNELLVKIEVDEGKFS